MSEKTWADVADKALDGIGETVRQVTDVVQTHAPRAWEALVSYHRAVAIGELCVSVAWVAAATVVLVWLFKTTRRTWEDSSDDAKAGSFIGAFICSLTLAYHTAYLPGRIARAVAPEYSAAMQLINAARGAK